MRKIFTTLGASLLLLGSACTDLDLQPQSRLTNQNVFDNPAAYDALMAKAYAGLALTGQQGPAGSSDIRGDADEGASNYIRQYWKVQELTTDEAVVAWNDADLRDYQDLSWPVTNSFVRTMYDRIFFMIGICNEILRESTDGRLDDNGINANERGEIPFYRAEARFLRALNYYHAIDLFGNPPFFTEDNTLGNRPPQRSRAEVFAFVESELREIENQLYAPEAVPYGRASQAAAWMLLAKLYLNAEVYTGQARYAECVEYCNKVINSGAFQLNDVYQHNFLADNNTSPEMIFPVTSDGRFTQTFGNTTFLCHAAVGGRMDPAEYGLDFGWAGLRTTSALVNLFTDSLDSRALFFTDGQDLEIGNIGRFRDGFAVPKFQNITSDSVPGSDPTFVDTDFPMFRLADAHLMYAEAAVRGSGDRGTAVNLVNALRQRAYGDDSGNITDADLTLDFVLNERARELYWEGHRRTDLIRFGRFTGSNYIWPWKGGVQEGRAVEDFRVLMPIPSTDLIANPNLTQNPGY